MLGVVGGVLGVVVRVDLYCVVFVEGGGFVLVWFCLLDVWMDTLKPWRSPRPHGGGTCRGEGSRNPHPPGGSIDDFLFYYHFPAA